MYSYESQGISPSILLIATPPPLKMTMDAKRSLASFLRILRIFYMDEICESVLSIGHSFGNCEPSCQPPGSGGSLQALEYLEGNGGGDPGAGCQNLEVSHRFLCSGISTILCRENWMQLPEQQRFVSAAPSLTYSHRCFLSTRPTSPRCSIPRRCPETLK